MCVCDHKHKKWCQFSNNSNKSTLEKPQPKEIWPINNNSFCLPVYDSVSFRKFIRGFVLTAAVAATFTTNYTDRFEVFLYSLNKLLNWVHLQWFVYFYFNTWACEKKKYFVKMKEKNHRKKCDHKNSKNNMRYVELTILNRVL